MRQSRIVESFDLLLPCRLKNMAPSKLEASQIAGSQRGRSECRSIIHIHGWRRLSGRRHLLLPLFDVTLPLWSGKGSHRLARSLPTTHAPSSSYSVRDARWRDRCRCLRKLLQARLEPASELARVFVQRRRIDRRLNKRFPGPEES